MECVHFRLSEPHQARGTCPLHKGPLSHLLKNRIYLGEINHHDKSYPGEDEALSSRKIVVKLTYEIAAKLGKVQLEIPWELKSKRPNGKFCCRTPTPRRMDALSAPKSALAS